MKLLKIIVLMLCVGGLAYTQTITVTEPHACMTWCKGNTYTIQWTTSGSMDAMVKIRLFDSTGTTKIMDIADNTNNDGSHPWLVPGTLATGFYRVRVKTMDNLVYDDSETVYINDCPAPTITVTAPHTGDSWTRGNPYTIQWTKSGSMDPKVKIRLFDSTGTTKILDIVNDTSNDGSYSWPIPVSVAPGNYRIRVKTLDSAVYDDSDTFNIKTDITIPFEVYAPEFNSFWWIGFKVPIRWKDKLMRPLKKVKSDDTKVILGSKVPIMKTVKIQVQSVKCPFVAQRKELLRKVYSRKEYKLKDSKIRELLNKPWEMPILNWKTIAASTSDDGAFDWKVPTSYKKGCYKVRVTKLWGTQGSADSNTFHLVPIFIMPGLNIGIFNLPLKGLIYY